jgi:hypothetical protein
MVNVVLCPGRIQNPGVVVGLVLGACPMLPCLVPLVLQTIRTTMEATTERKIAAHIMILWKYKPLNQGMMFFDPRSV